MKKLGIILISILCVLCVAIDVWFVVIHFTGAKKELSNTMNIDILETTNGSQKEPFIEVNYYSNENKNGLELFEVRLNYFQDENQDRILSVGIQYVANSIEDNIKFKVNGNVISYNMWKEERTFLKYHDYWNVFFNTFLTGNNGYYEYQSSDGYETILGNSINTINKDSRFKVSMGDDKFQLGLKFDSPEKDFLFYSITQGNVLVTSTEEHYQYVDQHLLAYRLFESVKKASFGEAEYSVAQFSNFFNYYKYDSSSKQYTEIQDIETSKVTTLFENNYVIKVNKYKDGAVVSSDSIFNTIKGDSLFNLTGDYVVEDYYFGRSIIRLTNKHFTKVENADGTYKYALNSDFSKSHKEYKDKIVLDIDLTISDTSNYLGLVDDSLLDFKIYDYSVNGESVELGVLYA